MGWAVATSPFPSEFSTLIWFQIGIFPLGACLLLYYLKFREKFEEHNLRPAHFGSNQLSFTIKYKDILVPIVILNDFKTKITKNTLLLNHRTRNYWNYVQAKI